MVVIIELPTATLGDTSKMGMLSALKRRLRGSLASQWYPTEVASRQARLATLQQDGRLTLGAHTYGSPRIITFEGDPTHVAIGSYTSIAETAVIVAGGNHRGDWASTFPFRARWGLPGALHDGQPWSKGDIVIGSDVWIGEGATILSGVEIGHGAIVGAASVVTKSVPPYTVVAGSPATVRKARFDEETTRRLLALRWWDWTEARVRANVNTLSAPLTEATLAALERSGGQ